MVQILMVAAGALIMLLEAVSTFVPYKSGKYRRRARPAKARKQADPAKMPDQAASQEESFGD